MLRSYPLVVATPVDTREDSSPWRRLLAIGLVAGDRTVAGIARYAGVHPREAADALETARQRGVIETDGTIDPLTATNLIADLPADLVVDIHAAAARHLFAAGPDRLPEAIDHVRSAVTTMPIAELLTMVDRGGKLSLSLGDYATAHELLALGVDHDTSNDLVTQGHRLCDLANAADGLGRVAEARQHLARAINLGEMANNSALVARAAIMHALPADWFAGDPRTLAFLQRASSMGGDPQTRTALAAARAIAEIRIPVTSQGGHQWAWATRPSIAHPLAEEALATCETCSDEVKALVHIAWRTTHRAPEFLERRRQISARAGDLAQRLRFPTFQVEAAIWSAVDALEAGDRAHFDESLAVARWVSRADGNPRLRWRALTLAAGAALLDEDDDALDAHRRELKEFCEDVMSPGSLAVDSFFFGQQVIRRNDPDALKAFRFPDDFAGLSHPMIRASVAYAFAHTGDPEIARRHALHALRQIDSESSYLLVATRVAAVAIENRDLDLARTCRQMLAPWWDRVAVDANGWWCDGPVAAWLAGLCLVLDDHHAARRYLDTARPLARTINDVASIRRLDVWETALHASPIPPQISLSDRERRVLELLAAGATNPQIASQLNFSTSTIRVDTISIYRKLSVSGRAEAVAKALSLGLLSAAD